MRRRRGIMGLNGGAGIPVIAATATGNPLTFETDMIKPLKSLVIPFTPIQAAGTPTPDAPLPISGWTGCNITHRGKNLFDKNNFKTLRGVSNNLVFDTSTAWGLEFPCLPNTTYIFTRQTTVCNRFNAYDCEDSAIVDGSHFLHSSGNVTGNTLTFTTKPTAKTIFLYLNTASTASSVRTNFNNTVAGLQIEFGDTSTTYNSYSGEIIPVSWQTKAGTVYGGTVTLNEDGSADLLVTKRLVTYNGSESWSGMTGDNARYWIDKPQDLSDAGTITGCFASCYDSEHILPRWTSNYQEWGYLGVSAANFVVYDGTKHFNSLSSFKSWLATLYNNGTPFQIVCPLKEPIPYHFDDIGQLITFVGTNNIWTDTNGTNTATYLKHQS